MTQKEFEEAHAERKDAFNHTIRVGDLVAFHWYSNITKIGKVTKICFKSIKIVPIDCLGERQIHPSNVIKLKNDAIPED